VPDSLIHRVAQLIDAERSQPVDTDPERPRPA